MAEFAAQDAQFAYNNMANQVLDGERKDISRNSKYSGEAQSLKDIDVGRMGSRAEVVASESDDLKKILELSKKREINEDTQITKRKRTTKSKKNIDIVDALDDTITQRYTPKTPLTQNAYDRLLSFIRERLGDYSSDLLVDAAEDLLTVLKDKEISQKHDSVEAIIPHISDNDLNKLIKLSDEIIDFNVNENNEEEDDENDKIYAFHPSDDEKENSQYLTTVVDESDSESEEEEEEENMEENEDVDMENHHENEESTTHDLSYNLNVEDIDAHWIQRRLSAFIDDPNIAQKYSDDIIEALGSKDTNQSENTIVDLVGIENDELIKTILHNKTKLYYVIRYRQAQTDEQRNAITEEMINDIENDGKLIYNQLTSNTTIDKLEQRKRLQFNKETTFDTKNKSRNTKHTTQDEQQEGAFHSVSNDASIPNPKQVLDLESLEFTRGAHQMSNTTLKLPDQTFRVQGKGYEEVHVPAQIKKKVPQENLVKINTLPSWAQNAFKGMDRLNPVQSKIYQTAMNTSENILLCAPTGAGKTNVAVLTIMHEIGLHLREDGSVDKDKFKIVYVAPMKALVKEVVDNFSQRLSDYGLKVRELSGDINLTKEEIADTQLIVTTPEKWDIITRKSGERTYTQLVRLIIIDEIHLLHDERGPVIESIVSRTLRQIESTQEMVRLVGLSATLPNYMDVATFLRVDKGLFYFDNSYRPIPLEQQFIGITEKKALKARNLMNRVCYEKVLAEAGKNQVIIFVHSRKETVNTARALREIAFDEDTLANFIPEGSGEQEILKSESENCKNDDLRDLLPSGFAVHHAGLSREDRSLIEDLFADRKIPVLVSTMTLAWGVNLPAHTVIIKGTQMYNPEKGKWVELSPQDILQMLGRAGRPQYDNSGEGIIITKHSELQYYLSLMNQQLPIESQFIKKLSDNMNAEIVMGSIQNVGDAVNWLGYTYLYIRMLRNPQLYSIELSELEQDPILLQRRVDLIHSAALVLSKNGLIKYERRTGSFQSTSLGRIAAYYYITNASIAVYNENLKPTLSDVEIFKLFSLSNEFSQIIVRQEEKLELKKLLENVPIPIRETVEDPSAKVNVLLQAYISRQKLDGFALASDLVFVQQSASRIFRALYEICLKRCWSGVSQRILNICKCVDKRLWLSQSPLRQFNDALSEDILKKLESNPLNFGRYYDLQPADFNEMTNEAKSGKRVFNLVHKIPRLDVETRVQPLTRSVLKVELVLNADFNYDEKYHGKGEGFHILVEDGDGETILHYEFFVLKKKYFDDDHIVSFTVPLFEPMSPNYFLRIISDRWIHSTTYSAITFDHLILPDKFYPNVELVDLQPLTLSCLNNPEYEALYKDKFTIFNHIQTHVFDRIYKSDNNILICAPGGSGKTFMAELAILKHLNSDNEGKILYLAANQDVLNIRYDDWKKFETLGLSVCKLVGDLNEDEMNIASSQLILTTPDLWDRISRRWKTKKSIQALSLVIADDIHMLNSQKGFILEAVLTRLLYMINALNKTIRIVALGSSIGNAKSLSTWLGCDHGLFNFHTSARPIPLETYIEGFDVINIGTRVLAMSKPTYNSILNLSGMKPALVFVPSKKQAQMTSVDLFTYARASTNGTRFLHCSQEEIDHVIEQIQDPALKIVLASGIGFCYKGMNPVDRLLVLELYKQGKIQVLVATHDTCWSLQVQCHLVIIMETTYYEGKEHGYVDYSINDMLQMISLANRPGIDSVSKCVILCYTPKKDIYSKFINEPLCVESQLYKNLCDTINSEVVSSSIENFQEASDFLTYSYLVRRLLKNPIYYGMNGSDNDYLNDYLSDLIQDTFTTLSDSGLVSVDEDSLEVSALSTGIIASYYYVHYDTISIFSQSVKETLKRKGILEIMCSASEFEDLNIRHHESETIRQELAYLTYPVKNNSAISQKVNYLLQNYFSRKPLSIEYKQDLILILPIALRLLHSMVDISNTVALKPVLSTIEFCQMIVQGMWAEDSRLLQLPYFDKDLVELCESEGIQEVYDIIDCEDEQREKLFKNMTPKQIDEIAKFCNVYPSIDLEYDIENKEELTTDDVISVNIKLVRDVEEDEDPKLIGKVYSQSYPCNKREFWWLIIGDLENNKILANRCVNVKQQNQIKLQFNAPEEPGHYKYTLYFMTDSYLGCDQENPVELDIKQGEEQTKEDSNEEEDVHME